MHINLHAGLSRTSSICDHIGRRLDFVILITGIID